MFDAAKHLFDQLRSGITVEQLERTVTAQRAIGAREPTMRIVLISKRVFRTYQHARHPSETVRLIG